MFYTSVFSSTAEYPCLPNLTKFFNPLQDFSYLDEYGLDILAKPETSCQHMHDYLEQMGMPSYVKPVEGFELSVELINESAGVYRLLDDHFRDTGPMKNR